MQDEDKDRDKDQKPDKYETHRKQIVDDAISHATPVWRRQGNTDLLFFTSLGAFLVSCIGVGMGVVVPGFVVMAVSIAMMVIAVWRS